jgi:hypothetical protein
MCTGYLEQAHPLRYVPILQLPLHPSFKQGFVGFIIQSSEVCMQWASLLLIPQPGPLPHVCPIIPLPSDCHHHFRSTSTNDPENEVAGLQSLVYLTQHGDLQFHPFSCK